MTSPVSNNTNTTINTNPSSPAATAAPSKTVTAVATSTFSGVSKMQEARIPRCRKREPGIVENLTQRQQAYSFIGWVALIAATVFASAKGYLKP